MQPPERRPEMIDKAGKQLAVAVDGVARLPLSCLHDRLRDAHEVKVVHDRARYRLVAVAAARAEEVRRDVAELAVPPA